MWRSRSALNVVPLAALAMVATLPGRSQGLGLITEPLLADLGLSRTHYSYLNFWATMGGALACLPVGWLLDRFGFRVPLVVVLAALGVVTCLMTAAPPGALLPLGLLLWATRSLGQSALSVISITMLGRLSDRLARNSFWYATLVVLLFAAAFPAVGMLVRSYGWHVAWMAVGASLMALAVVAALLTPDDLRTAAALAAQAPATELATADREAGVETWTDVFARPPFWIFTLATSLYALIVSGFGLFNEAILAEVGFDRSAYHRSLAVATLAGLAGQVVAALLAGRSGYPRVLALAMALYAAALLSLPRLHGAHMLLWSNSALMGAAGGMITVVFFAIWPSTFGPARLGRIQGMAQLATVVGSALGPVAFAAVQERTGSYLPVCHAACPAVFALALASACVPRPQPEPSTPGEVLPAT